MDMAKIAPTPPMGWNSYDYYNTEVNEAQVRENAVYMAKHLKPFGYEYVVVDISWYAPEAGLHVDAFQYNPFEDLVMDEYSRLLPVPDRFPSSEGGKGFAPLADYIHSLGLKFGIHVMRGIPRLAAHRHLGILGTDVKADAIADPASICPWNPYMYGVRPGMEASQAYYDSLYALYAEWGVDFIKVDDICREDAASAHEEIAMIHKAIEKSGRPMVLSLSPGPAIIGEAQFYAENANMWRITDDFWDSWELLRDMFRRCELWQGKAKAGAYPDCDMLPVGMIGGCFTDRKERASQLTLEEQRTMMTLWCICRSPLMIGAKLPSLDEETLRLLTNEEVLTMLRNISISRQILRTPEQAAWTAYDPVHDAGYIALFNLSDEETAVSYWLHMEEAPGFKAYKGSTIRELWSGKELSFPSGRLAVLVPAHGARVFRY